MEEFEKIKDVVERILKKDERAINSDKWLILEVLRDMGFKIYVDYKQLPDMPAFETITRSRRLILSENPNLKASPEVEEARDKKRKEYLDYFSPQTGMTETTNTVSKARNTVEVENATMFRKG